MCFSLTVAQPISNHSNRKSHTSYTNYDLLCHIVFNVNMVTFWMRLHMNNFTNFVMDDG